MSDNVAYNLLINSLDTQLLLKVHSDLSIPNPNESTPIDFVSVLEYSAIFRVLYNSSYLDRASSEYVLNLLSQVEYKDGLRAGVPSDIKVAHKHGVRNSNDQYLKQLHDCGIIYHPQNPYLLCIMTKGSDGQALTNTVQKISQVIFQTVNN